jgi:hypothetical protein
MRRIHRAAGLFHLRFDLLAFKHRKELSLEYAVSFAHAHRVHAAGDLRRRVDLRGFGHAGDDGRLRSCGADNKDDHRSDNDERGYAQNNVMLLEFHWSSPFPFQIVTTFSGVPTVA